MGSEVSLRLPSMFSNSSVLPNHESGAVTMFLIVPSRDDERARGARWILDLFPFVKEDGIVVVNKDEKLGPARYYSLPQMRMGPGR